MPHYLRGQDDAAAILSFFVRRMPVSLPQGVPILKTDDVERIIESESLPAPARQADNLLRWIGDNVPGPGEWIEVKPKALTANRCGWCKIRHGVQYLLEGLEERGLILGEIFRDSSGEGGGNATTSFEGWERIEELQRGAATGNMAFMAMQYRDDRLDPFVQTHFVPAVAETGFQLQRLDDVPKAGLIDDRMRVEIQSCRFLIADLSHANNGAYWEAGYAEGLGKPVIYTCEKSAFDDIAKKPHFDTNHHLTVIWTYDDPATAAENLKATIRATLPDAARQVLETA
ncbi:MAG: hypothetical protein OSB58_02400 [Alphaproteobacteria bacterium]|nr:hypothetical protein [Alphaproteobacteria bacterium]